MNTYLVNPPETIKNYATSGALAADVNLVTDFSTANPNGAGIQKAARQIIVGVTGNVQVQTVSGSVAIYYNWPVGIPLIGQFAKLLAAGTTATSITVGW